MTSTFPFCGYDIPVDLAVLTGSGVDNFAALANSHIEELRKYIKIEPCFSIVEVGSGIGRDAIILSNILSNEGNYLGTDVTKPSVDWCTKHISARNSNFRFVHHDVYNEIYNPVGKKQVQDIVLPVENASVDLCILRSVFTHMFKDEILHYMHEFHRVLKPSGRVWSSWFIVDPDILAHVGVEPQTTWALSFRHRRDEDSWINDPTVPRAAVSYRMEAVERMLAAAGLEVDGDPLPGHWSGTHLEPKSGQDVLILRKVEKPRPQRLSRFRTYMERAWRR